MSRPPIRLLILGDASDRVREFHVPRALVVGVLSLGLSSLAAFGAGVFFVATRAAKHAATQAAPAQPLAHQLKRPGLAAPVAREAPSLPCAAEMLLIEGNYCPQVRQSCVKHLDPDGSVLRSLRCAEYAAPSVCTSTERTALTYCIDREEHAPAPHAKASNHQTLASAQASCEAQGKRLCSEAEWTFACEGEAMQPYPYGFVRDGARCNTDETDLVTAAGTLRDLRADPNAFPKCVSPFGVHNLSGNVEEYVLASDGSALRKGAYWQPGAAHCRARQSHTDVTYSGAETGFRCCADARRP